MHGSAGTPRRRPACRPCPPAAGRVGGWGTVLTRLATWQPVSPCFSAADEQQTSAASVQPPVKRPPHLPLLRRVLLPLQVQQRRVALHALRQPVEQRHELGGGVQVGSAFVRKLARLQDRQVRDVVVQLAAGGGGIAGRQRQGGRAAQGMARAPGGAPPAACRHSPDAQQRRLFRLSQPASQPGQPTWSTSATVRCSWKLLPSTPLYLMLPVTCRGRGGRGRGPASGRTSGAGAL